MATVQKPCDCNSPSKDGPNKQAQLTVISLAHLPICRHRLHATDAGLFHKGSRLRVDFSRGWKESSRQCPAIRTESCSSRRQGLFGGRKGRTIGADLVATVALCPIEGRICEFHQLNRIARVVRKRSYTNANCNVVRLQVSGRSLTHCSKFVFLDGRTHALCSYQALRIVRIEQEGGELFAAKASRDVTGPQLPLDDASNLLERLA